MYRYCKKKENFLLQESSEKTRQTYRTALKRFSGFAEKEGLQTALNQEGLRALLLYLHKDYELQGTSINTYNGLCKFFLKVVLNPSSQKDEISNVQILAISRKPRERMHTLASPSLV